MFSTRGLAYIRLKAFSLQFAAVFNASCRKGHSSLASLLYVQLRIVNMICNADKSVCMK